MNRSTTFAAKCCVPTCKNTTTNSRNKLFVHVREALKRRWSQESNIKFMQGKRVYCCEDHLNLQEDLENYQFWKLMKGKPSLKLTAKLRTSNVPTCSKYITTDPVESPTLKSLLLQPNKNFQTCRRKKVFTDNNNPIVKLTATCPVKIDAGTQCTIQMIDQSTSTESMLQSSEPKYSQSSSCCDLRLGLSIAENRSHGFFGILTDSSFIKTEP